jgi:protein phosphatase
MASIRVGFSTDVGLVREKNQDSLSVEPSERFGGKIQGLFLVADGMGGMAGGEIASRMTAKIVPETLAQELLSQHDELSDTALADALCTALRTANDAVWREARSNPELRGMGTTCVAAAVRNGTLCIAHAGDSRIYRMRGGELRQLTSDHSLVQEYVRSGEISQSEAGASRYRNVITRGIGIARDVEPDVEVLPLLEGDALLLCSDGLTNMVTDAGIARIMASIEDPRDAAEALVAESNRNGGEDNITALVVRYGPFTSTQGYAAAAEIPPNTNRNGQKYTVLLLSMLVVAVAALVVWLAWLQYGSRPPSNTPAGGGSPAAVPPHRDVNFDRLVWGTPEVLNDTPVAAGPLLVDAHGVCTALASDGRVIRIPADRSMRVVLPLVREKSNGRDSIYWCSDPAGNLYISSPVDKAILKFAQNGTRKAVIGKGKLTAPGALGIDAQGNLYVSDAGRLKRLAAHEEGP